MESNLLMECIICIVASLSKDDATPVNDGEHFIRDISLTGIGESFKEKSPIKDNVAVENEYVQLQHYILYE